MCRTDSIIPLFFFWQQTLSELAVIIEEEESKVDDDGKNTSGWNVTRPFNLATRDIVRLFSILSSTAIYLSVWAIPCGILFILVRSLCWRKTMK